MYTEKALMDVITIVLESKNSERSICGRHR